MFLWWLLLVKFRMIPGGHTGALSAGRETLSLGFLRIVEVEFS